MSARVLVTGAASGIGQRIAADFATAGWAVTGVDVRTEALVETMDAIGGSPVTADLSTADGPVTAVEDAGELDALVNAAGIYPATPFQRIDAALWDRVMALNVRAAMLTTQTFAAAGRPGSVVNISSGASLRSRPGAAHYATSKAALEVLTRSTALELGEFGIRVNAVSPGFVTVDSTANPVTEEYAAAVSANPLGRVGQPADISSAVQWLVSDAAGWITGTVLRVDGGAATGNSGLPLHWSETTEVQGGMA